MTFNEISSSVIFSFKRILKKLKNNSIPFSLAGAGIITIYYLIFHQFFPDIQGKMGHDYAQHLPEMLDGYYWFRSNGIFSVPWFTPSFCGGLPLIANPRSMYYSIPQFLTFITNPLNSIKITLLFFAIIGWHGSYVLLRRIFFTSRWTALFGATLFLFNGLYANRMLIGHIDYHGFMLMPIVTFLLLEKSAENFEKMWRIIFEIFLVGIMFAYMLLSGMVQLLIPTIVSIIIIGFVYGIIYQEKFKSSNFFIKLLLAGGVGICLSSFKIVPMLTFAGYFPRDFYPLPGVESIFKIFKIIFISLFWEPAHKMADSVFVNKIWYMEQQEFEIGVTIVPLVILAIGIGLQIRNLFIPGNWRNFHRKQWIYACMIIFLLTLPVIFNYYTPSWNTFLKTLPLIKSSSSMLRWFSIYIPIVILLSAITIEKTTFFRKYHICIVIICILIVIAWNYNADRSYYQNRAYNPNIVLQAYNKTKTGTWNPAITHIMVYVDQSGEIILPMFRHEAVAYGCSQLFCYEPIFGYRQEIFPIKTLHPGPVMDIKDGYLNIKNPACYVYPKENHCSPGDHFTTDQRNLAKAFVHFKPFPFKVSALQKVANFLSLATLIVVMEFLTVYAFRSVIKKIT